MTMRKLLQANAENLPYSDNAFHKAGFENISTQNHLFSKYWIAYKPL